MKKYIRPIVAMMLLGAGTTAMYAIPAKKGIRTITQADGTTAEVELVGDEFAHMYVTPDGYPLAEKGGILYYAGISADGNVEASDLKLTSLQKRSAAAKDFLKGTDRSLVAKALQKRAAASLLKRSAARTSPGNMRAPQGPGLSPGSDFPVTGSPHVLVILAEYSDVSMSLANANDYFTRMMTERGFSDYKATGSALDYFDENSTGQFTPVIDVFGPVKLPKTRAYYGGNTGGEDNVINAAQMIADACEALDGEIDFTKYDTDGDRVIDNVFVFYAGRGEADGGPAESVWPHAWYVKSGAGITKFLDGMLLDRYACSNEYGASQPDGVGTFIHEFSHVMGLPDLYPTDYSSAFTPGEWSALDYGPYNNNGRTPPRYSAFERYALGWIEPVVIDGPMSAVLHPIGDNMCGIIKTDKTNEFFLIENRQQTSWDTYIPGHGMLVWHIDYNSRAWNNNTVNNTTSHQYVDIEEADGKRTASTRGGDAFPGTAKVTSFTDDTTPSMKTWSGKSLGLPITNITESSGIICFDVAGGGSNAPVAAPTALAASDIGLTGFTANWQADGSTDYLLSVYKKDAEGNKIYTKYNRTNVGSGTSAKVEGLEAITTYYYTVTAISGFTMSEASNEISVTTLRPGIDSFAIVALPASGIGEDRFTANWELLPEATGYFLSVYELTSGSPTDFTTGFDDNALPPEWSSPRFSMVRLARLCGKAVPAVSVADGSYIETAEYGDIYTLSFWHRSIGNSTGSVVVSARIGGEWSVCKEFDLMASGKTDEVKLPEGSSAVRIGFSGSGSIHIDDVTLNYAGDIARTAVAPYENYDVGNVSSYEVTTGLTPGKNYSYTVQGYDGVKQSKVSAEVRVRTHGVSGIARIGSGDGLRVRAADGVLYVSGIAAETAVTVYDISGRIMDSGRGECSFRLRRGVYIVRAGAEAVVLGL